MGKKKNKNICLMQEWPDDDTYGVDSSDLIKPLKQIISEGYKLERTAQTQFIYNGYNVGKEECEIYFPTPAERFSSRWLNNEAKFHRTLLDNVLTTVFQLGIEQGRRTSKTERNSNEILEDIILLRSNRIKELREKLAEYGDPAGIIKEVPIESDIIDLNIDDCPSSM